MTITRLLPLAALLLAACVTNAPIDPTYSGRKDAGDIHLTLKDAKGAPLAGRSVSAELATAGYRLATSPVQPARGGETRPTDEAGEVWLSPLLPGTYVVSVVGTAPLVSKRVTLAGGQRLTMTLTVPNGAWATPSPSPSPTPSTTPSPSPSPSATPTATPDPNATPTPAYVGN